jgi:hypothetical protein
MRTFSLIRGGAFLKIFYLGFSEIYSAFALVKIFTVWRMNTNIFYHKTAHFSMTKLLTLQKNAAVSGRLFTKDKIKSSYPHGKAF